MASVMTTEQARALAAQRVNPGRKSKAKEITYLEAVKRGAPPDEVTKAVRAVLKRAVKQGDQKALTAVLQYLVAALNRTEQEITGDTDKPIAILFGKDVPESVLRGLAEGGKTGTSAPATD